MTRDEAIKRTSLLLQKLFHDDEELIAIIRVAARNKDIDNLTSALDQLIMTCYGLKKGFGIREMLLNQTLQQYDTTRELQNRERRDLDKSRGD